MNGPRHSSDYKRVKATPKHRDAETLLRQVLELLAADMSLPERNRDHALSGKWQDHRDCHLKPDLILGYRKPDKKVVQLVRLGSHSDLGL